MGMSRESSSPDKSSQSHLFLAAAAARRAL
jgi:hypothetical protein